MARPKKKGLDYFPKDVNFYHSQINRIIYNENGIYALVLYDFILCYIYEKEGYYMTMDRVFKSIVKDGIGLDMDDTERLVDALINIGIFDRELYEKYSILTSDKIQRIYITAKRKKADVINDEYRLIADETVFVSETPCFCSENPPKKSKENKSKENESKTNKSKLNLLLLHQRKEEGADIIRRDDEDDEDDDEKELNFVIEEYKTNISDIKPFIEEEISKWVDITCSDFVISGIREAAKRGARTWQYVDTLLNNNYNMMITRGTEKTYEIDNELGF